MEATGSKNDVYKICSKELERMSGGSLFNGISLLNTTNSNSKQKVTVCPPNMEKLQPSMPEGKVFRDIDSIHSNDQTESNLNSLGMSITLKMGVANLKLEGSFSKTSEKSSTIKKSTASQCMVITVPKYAIRMESDKLDLDLSFIDALEEFERFIVEDIGVTEQLMIQTRKLFDKFGTHINTGLIHIGGLRMFRAQLECQKEESSSELQSQLKLALEGKCNESRFGIGLVGGLGNGNYEQERKITNKPASESKHIHVETVTIGGCHSENDLEKWSDSVHKPGANLTVIDRSELIGIWELVRKCKGKLRHPKGLALILRWVFGQSKEEDTKDYTEEEENDFTNLLLQSFRAKLQTTESDDFDVRAFFQRLDFCKKVVGNNRIIEKLDLDVGRRFQREIRDILCNSDNRGANIERDVVFCFDELDREGACADFMKKQAHICIDLWNKLEPNLQMAAVVYNNRSKTVLNQDFDKEGLKAFLENVSLSKGCNQENKDQDTVFIRVVKALRSLSWRGNSRRVVIFIGDFPKSIEDLLMHLKKLFLSCNATDFKVHWFSTSDVPCTSIDRPTPVALQNTLGFSNTRLWDKKRVTREILTVCCNTVDEDRKEKLINASSLEENDWDPSKFWVKWHAIQNVALTSGPIGVLGAVINKSLIQAITYFTDDDSQRHPKYRIYSSKDDPEKTIKN